MCSSKTRHAVVAICFACVAAGCAPPRIAFSDNDARHMALYSRVLKGDTSGSIVIYKTGFSDKLVETGSSIRRASLNDETMREIVTYRPQRKGYRQELYLAQVTTAAKSETWFYYSVWYRQNKKSRQEEPYGFGR